MVESEGDDELNSYSQLNTFEMTTEPSLSQTPLLKCIQFSSTATSILKNRS